MAVPVQEKNAVLFDGRCNFCRQQMEHLLRLARAGSLEPVDFQQPGALHRFPGVTHEACMEAMHLVTAQGRVYRGFEAAVHAVATKPVLGKLAYLYYLPGLRWVCDRFYAWLASRRYRLAGECASGACALHQPPRQKAARNVQKAEETNSQALPAKEKLP